MIGIRKNEYPSKTTVNLIIHEKTISSPTRAIPVFCVFLAVLAVFVKFGVMMPLERMYAAQASLEQVQSELGGYVQYNKDYNEVRERYSRFFSDYLDEDEAVLQDRMEVMNLFETCVMNQADIESISIRGNVCRMVITELPLYQVSSIVAELEASPLVQYISVSTASTEKRDEDEEVQPLQSVSADLTITLTGGNR
ncbi:hypothetical protein GPL15_22120 [Clostridium sp. MCC353]|uniref:hypothetical protein n=1 Tax=Clostridium sp. MCC353 TaxID=2592646 RepID=UPI001C0094EA|nr:hypothetical protein [Clostridium sp. MCC353]MBT9779179.1 hypothetical protein [Clostridium sp. MCC353]